MNTKDLAMHSEHRQWLSDDSMWRDDLALWRKEIDESLDELGKLEDALHAHRANLQIHLDTFMAGEKEQEAHEHALAEFERGDTRNELQLLAMAKAHKKHADEHVQQRQAHERLKKLHHTMMAHWALLFKALVPERVGS